MKLLPKSNHNPNTGLYNPIFHKDIQVFFWNTKENCFMSFVFLN